LYIGIILLIYFWSKVMKKKTIHIPLLCCLFLLFGCHARDDDLWQVYEKHFTGARYVDLTHAFSPDIPVWPGFGKAKFLPAEAGRDMPGYIDKGEIFSIEKHGFIATSYMLPTDQYGTQLDPPAHWNPYGATISDLPPTYAIRPLVVIDIHEKVVRNEGYHCSVSDIEQWERKHGRIPAGSVVMVRSDWYKKWGNSERYNQKPFPGVGIEALKFLHENRKILFHGHEPLDTDTTATLEGEYWLLHHNYCQAEGVMNLDKVPEKGALVTIGFAKPEGGTGGFARYVAICPPDWKYGSTIKDLPGAPLSAHKSRLNRNKQGILVETE
jgi:kynurenine formamidase